MPLHLAVSLACSVQEAGVAKQGPLGKD